jgi:hypothetical protein
MTEKKDIGQIIKTNYLQPAFLICAGMLLITASAMSITIKRLGLYLSKEPIPLKKPLSQMDSFDLSPYKVVMKHIIENKDVLETLGTEDYIQWELENTNDPQTSSTRCCSLFITYYSLPDIVPHRPEECYVGSGNRQISSDGVVFEIGEGNKKEQINASYLTFTGSEPDQLIGETKFGVLYFFSVNGKFLNGRTDARFNVLMKNLLGKFSYFSKVEWKFYNNKFGRVTFASKEESLEASKKMLAVIVPILEKEHWPQTSPQAAGPGNPGQNNNPGLQPVSLMNNQQNGRLPVENK